MKLLLPIAAALLLAACSKPATAEQQAAKQKFNEQSPEMATDKISKTDAEWKAQLTPQQYEVLREKGTERAGSGELLHVEGKGTFVCAACGNPLYDSETKFESGTGWPSFYQPLKGRTTTATDSSYGMTRDEVLCTRCGGHLGHVFNDGPPPTGLRYCMNSVAMKFEKAK